MRTHWAMGLTVIGLICGGVAKAQPGAEKPAAVVNGEAVALAEVKAVLDQRPSPVPLSTTQQRELRHAALDMLIDDVLMRQFLRKSSGVVATGAVEKELDELKVVLKKQGKTYEQFLHEAKQTDGQLRGDVVARLQWKSYLLARYPEAETRAYYEANKVMFDKIQVRASHILVKVGSSSSPMDKGLAKSRLETLRQEILTGKIDFAEAARKYSECPSKDKGGDIGLFPYKFVVVEPFAKAAFTMKVGEISDIVTSDFGFHLIKVTDRTKGEATTYETTREGIRDIMAQEQELFTRVLAEQRKGSKIDVLMP